MLLVEQLRSVACITVLAVLTGCTGQSNLADDAAVLSKSSEGLSPQAATLLHEAQAPAKTRALAATIGGVTGLAAGLYASSRTRDPTLKGAEIAGGLAAGTAVGYAAGAYVAARNSAAASNQSALNRMTDAAQQDAARYQQDRLRAQAAIDECRVVLEQLQREQKSGTAMSAAFREQAKNLDVTAVSLRSMIHEVSDNLAFLQNDIPELARHHQDISGLEQQRVALQIEHDGLIGDYRQLLAVVDTMPATERPVITASLP
jgi:hypothetical protein